MWHFAVCMSPVFPAYRSLWKQRNCCQVVQTAVWFISYSGELCNKSCIVKTSQMLIIWSAFCYTAVCNNWVPDRLLKEWWWCLAYTVECWATVGLWILIVGIDCEFWGHFVQDLNVVIKLIGIFSIVWFSELTQWVLKHGDIQNTDLNSW